MMMRVKRRRIDRNRILIHNTKCEHMTASLSYFGEREIFLVYSEQNIEHDIICYCTVCETFK